MEKFLHSKRNYLFPCVQYALFIWPIVIQVVIIMCHLLMYVFLHALRFSTLFLSLHIISDLSFSWRHSSTFFSVYILPLCRYAGTLSYLAIRLNDTSCGIVERHAYPCLWSVSWAAETVELHLWVDFYCLLCFRCLRRLLNYITWFSRSLLSNTSK